MDRRNRMTGKEWRRERQATESQIERVNMTHTHTHTHTQNESDNDTEEEEGLMGRK